MPDYIDRNLLVELTSNNMVHYEDIMGLPAEDAMPVRRARWETIHGVCTPGGDPLLRCPFCRNKNSEHLGGIEMPERWNFCPNCGAFLAGDGHMHIEDNPILFQGETI